MLIFVDIDSQSIIEQPGVLSSPGSISVPRASNVPIWVQFVRDGAVIDPEAQTATILTSSVASNTVVTTDGPHGFSNGDSLVIEGHAGVGHVIVSSSIASPTLITTAEAHGFSVGDIVTFEGHVGAQPSIDGEYRVSAVPSTTTFNIALAVTTGSSGGTVTRLTSTPTLVGTHTISSVTETTFTISGLAITAAGVGGTASKLTDLDLRWTVKEDGKFDQDPPMASITSGDFTKTGSGANTIFKGQCNYITTALNTLLRVDGVDSNDVIQAKLMAELSWAGANPAKTNWVTHYVRNDLYKTGEGDPVAAGGQDGRTTIGSSLSEKAVVFSPALSTANWHFLGAPSIWNTTTDALGISFVGLSAKSASGFTAILSGETDTTGTYYMDWSVRPD